MGNLAAVYWAGGRLREAWQLWVDAGEEAERYGQASFARWFARHPRRQGVRVRAVGRRDCASGCVPTRGRGGIAALPVRPDLCRPSDAPARPRRRRRGVLGRRACARALASRRGSADRPSDERPRRPRLLGGRTERARSAVGGRVPGGHPGGAGQRRRLQHRLLARARLDACRGGPRRGSCGGAWRPGPRSPGPSRARRTPAATTSRPRRNALRWAQSLRRPIRDSRPRGPAISLSSSRRSSSTARSAQSGICARASRSSPRPPSCRSAGTRPCARRVPASRGSRR